MGLGLFLGKMLPQERAPRGFLGKLGLRWGRLGRKPGLVCKEGPDYNPADQTAHGSKPADPPPRSSKPAGKCMEKATAKEKEAETLVGDTDRTLATAATPPRVEVR